MQFTYELQTCCSSFTIYMRRMFVNDTCMQYGIASHRNASPHMKQYTERRWDCNTNEMDLQLSDFGGDDDSGCSIQKYTTA